MPNRAVSRRTALPEPGERSPYKTASWFIGGVERWFVIPSHLSIDQLVISGSERRISDEITAQTCDEERAKLIAEALNKYGVPNA